MKFFAREFFYSLILLIVSILLLPIAHVVDWSGVYLNCWHWLKTITSLQSDSGLRFTIVAFFSFWVLVFVLGVVFLLLKIPSSKASLKVRATQLFLSLVLLFSIELYLDWQGYAPGSLFRHFRIVEPLNELPNQYADSLGVIRYIKGSGFLPSGYVINKAGFRSKYEYDSTAVHQLKEKGKKVVMVIGDSFVAGLSAEPVTNCFADLLESDSVAALNFGMLGTDAVQYELVCSLYMPQLKPDAVVVCLYENDFLTYERKPIPGMPIYYRTNSSPNGGMMLAQKPLEFGFAANDNFKNVEEAYHFYLEHYTIRKNTNAVVRFFSYSSILTQLYIKIAQPMVGTVAKNITGSPNDAAVQNILFKTLKPIKDMCRRENVSVFFCGIPSAKEISHPDPIVLRSETDSIVIDYPENFSIADYSGAKGDIHFNNEGHKKYAEFLRKLLL